MIAFSSCKVRKTLFFGALAVLLGSLPVALFWGDSTYPAIIALDVLVSIVLFLSGFSDRRIGARRLILSSIFTALSVVGRFLPFLKPVTAVTILSGMWLGGEAGFLTGAMSAFLSNFAFGQGPWTPFQMLAWGLLGLLAGVFAPLLKRSRFALLSYGALSGALFSLVMDVFTVFFYAGAQAEPILYGAAMVSALPFSALYAVSNVAFLWLLAKPVGEKFCRIERKYGL